MPSLQRPWLGRLAPRRASIVTGVVAVCSCCCLAILLGFWLGASTRLQQASTVDELAGLPQIKAASATATDSMAIATGRISEDADGVFFLDFNTGDLQCLVYSPRMGGFGARYYGNITPQLGGGGKNAEYLMVTGQAIVPAATSTTRPGASLVYVTNVTSGMFAAYAVPWDANAERSRRLQSGSLVYVGGGPIRNYQLQKPNQNPPAAIVDPGNQNDN